MHRRPPSLAKARWARRRRERDRGLGLDSVDILEIALLLDKHFGVMLEEQNEEVHQALTNISTLAAFIDLHASPPAP